MRRAKWWHAAMRPHLCCLGGSKMKAAMLHCRCKVFLTISYSSGLFCDGLLTLFCVLNLWCWKRNQQWLRIDSANGKLHRAYNSFYSSARTAWLSECTSRATRWHWASLTQSLLPLSLWSSSCPDLPPHAVAAWHTAHSASAHAVSALTSLPPVGRCPLPRVKITPTCRPM